MVKCLACRGKVNQDRPAGMWLVHTIKGDVQQHFVLDTIADGIFVKTACGVLVANDERY